MLYRFYRTLQQERLLKKLFTASLLLAMTAAANATDWVQLGEGASTEVFVDADSIKYVNKKTNVRTAWVRINYTQDSGNIYAGEYSLGKNNFDCKNTRFQVGSVIQYFPNGETKTMTSKSSGWLDVAPRSNFEVVYHAVCDYPYI